MCRPGVLCSRAVLNEVADSLGGRWRTEAAVARRTTQPGDLFVDIVIPSLWSRVHPLMPIRCDHRQCRQAIESHQNADVALCPSAAVFDDSPEEARVSDIHSMVGAVQRNHRHKPAVLSNIWLGLAQDIWDPASQICHQIGREIRRKVVMGIVGHPSSFHVDANKPRVSNYALQYCCALCQPDVILLLYARGKF